jgi:hypothetical protein
MIRLIAVAFALAVATSAQAMSPVPLYQSDGMITQVREALRSTSCLTTASLCVAEARQERGMSCGALVLWRAFQQAA